MRKYLNPLILLLFFLPATFIYSFDFDSYKPRKLSNLIKDIRWIVQSSEEKTKKPVKIMSLNNTKYKIIIRLEDMPKKIGIKYKKFAEEISNSLFKMENLFTYQLVQKYDDINVVFLVQNSLMEYLPKEAKVGELIEFYVIFYEYRDQGKGKELFVLLNEFNTRSEKFDENILPDIE